MKLQEIQEAHRIFERGGLAGKIVLARDEELLQLRVLRFGLLQDGDVGVGVFPQGMKLVTEATRPDAVGR